VEDLIRKAEEIAKRRGLSLRLNTLLNQPAVAMDRSSLVKLTRQSKKQDAIPFGW